MSSWYEVFDNSEVQYVTRRQVALATGLMTALLALSVVYQNFVDITRYDFQQYGDSITASLDGFNRLLYVDPKLTIRQVYPLSSENARLIADPLQGQQDLERLFSQSERVLRGWYTVSGIALFIVLTWHVGFATYMLIWHPATDMPEVWRFVAYNATFLVIEVLLTRVAFMLASRAGQLRDLRCAVTIASELPFAEKLETVSRAIMLLRRDTEALKVINLEALASLLQKK